MTEPSGVQGAAPPRRTVALVGNPNTGKTTLFNRLTGTYQRIGNYPGTTVECKQGRLFLDGEDVQLLDLPGAYSLSSRSEDERVVVDCLLGRMDGGCAPDLAVCVLDSGNLERNLYHLSVKNMR